MKYFLSIFLLLSIQLQASSTVISGGVEYSVSQARNELTSQKPQNPNQELIKIHLFDSNRDLNIGYLLKGQTNLEDRILAYFSDGSYAVNYKDDSLHVYYYRGDGILTHTEERSSLNYPFKAYKYKLSGELENMSYRVTEKETFIFDNNGKLLAHWIGENCYDENNQIIMKRKYSSERNTP